MGHVWLVKTASFINNNASQQQVTGRFSDPGGAIHGQFATALLASGVGQSFNALQTVGLAGDQLQVVAPLGTVEVWITGADLVLP